MMFLDNETPMASEPAASLANEAASDAPTEMALILDVSLADSVIEVA